MTTDGPYHVYDTKRLEHPTKWVSLSTANSECVRLNGEAQNLYGESDRFEVRHSEGIPVSGGAA